MSRKSFVLSVFQIFFVDALLMLGFFNAQPSKTGNNAMPSESAFLASCSRKKLKLFQQIDFWTILKLLPYLKKSKSTLTYPRSNFRNSPSFILFSCWPLECLDVLNICHFFYNQYTVSIMLLIGSDGLINPIFNLNMPFLYC